jgi:glycosyltransferase involved in cell wall biosynthesis
VIHFDSLRSARRLAEAAPRLGPARVASAEAVELFDTDPDDPGLRQLWANLDGLHLPDAALAERARALGCPSRIPVMAIPPAPEHGLLETPATALDGGREIRACSMGELHWTSGFEYAMQAIALLRERGTTWRLTVIGTGPLLDALLYARRDLDLESAVEFIHDPDRAGTLESLRGAQVYVHSAVVPGATPGLVNAVAAAVPVVATDGGKLVGSLVGGGLHPTLPRRDPHALADAITRVAADTALARRLGESGRSSLAPLLASRGAEVEDLYREALDAGRSRKRAPKV